MTNPNLTLIGVVVDRSGSMSSCRSDMEGGLNTFINEQAKLPDQAELTLAQFDTEYEIVHQPMDIKKVPPYSLVPRGGTALLDAMGRFITEIGENLTARAEQDRPGRVIICVVTDGYENSSHDWSREQVRKLVTQQQDDYQWEFVFLGANIDAVAEGSSLGIRATSSMTFDTANAAASYNAMSGYVAQSRAAAPGAMAASFTDEDRKNAVRKDKGRTKSKT